MKIYRIARSKWIENIHGTRRFHDYNYGDLLVEMNKRITATPTKALTTEIAKIVVFGLDHNHRDYAGNVTKVKKLLLGYVGLMESDVENIIQFTQEWMADQNSDQLIYV